MKFSIILKNQHEINGYNAENQTPLRYKIASTCLCEENRHDVASLRPEAQSTQPHISEKWVNLSECEAVI